jgi:hypothetical protein
VPWVTNYLTANSIVPSASVSGKYYQLTSQIPGRGPCYPTWVATTEFFHRCFPAIPAEWSDSVVSKASGAATAVGDGAASLYKDQFNSASAQWDRYVSAISKGILIIIVGGLCGGLGLSLVGGCGGARREGVKASMGNRLLAMATCTLCVRPWVFVRAIRCQDTESQQDTWCHWSSNAQGNRACLARLPDLDGHPALHGGVHGMGHVVLGERFAGCDHALRLLL